MENDGHYIFMVNIRLMPKTVKALARVKGLVH